VAIGARTDQDDDQLKLGGGYDHNYVLRRSAGGGESAPRASSSPPPAASWKFGPPSPASSFTPEISRWQNSRQGRPHLSAPQRLLPGNPALSRFAESAEIPSVVLKPGERLPHHHTYKFSVEKVTAPVTCNAPLLEGLYGLNLYRLALGNRLSWRLDCVFGAGAHWKLLLQAHRSFPQGLFQSMQSCDSK